MASFNAASVWMLEQLAALLRERNHSGDAELAAGYEREAAALAKAVLSLYVEGQGFFSALYPNGTKIGVRCGKKRRSSFVLRCRFWFERRRPLAKKDRLGANSSTNDRSVRRAPIFLSFLVGT